MYIDLLAGASTILSTLYQQDLVLAPPNLRQYWYQLDHFINTEVQGLIWSHNNVVL